MKIALAQLNYTIGDIEGNKSKIIGAVERAKSEGADLVVFAEQALSGTPALDLLCKTTFIELCEEALDEIASHCGRIAAVVGVPVLTECGTVSAAAVIQHGEVERCISKRFITARREMGFLVQGSGCETITICGERVAVIVGDDLSRTSNFDKSVDLILSINARRFGKGMMTYRYNTMHDLAYVESKRIMLINQVGGSTEIVYDGTSAVVGADGQIELLMKSFEEDFAIFDTRAEHEPIAVPYTTYKDRTRMVYSAAVCGLHDYFGKNGYTKAAIGLSGGIDSAVVACLAVDALGRENVKALLMPSQFSSDHSVVDARELADNLGIAYDVVPITEAYKAVVDTMKPVIGGTAFDATEENIQARLRTVMLMALQNKCGYILLNSSNKSENALGFCTLYGDTAGAFSVTGDLYKGEIYDLARYINKLSHNDSLFVVIITVSLVGTAPGIGTVSHPACLRGADSSAGSLGGLSLLCGLLLFTQGLFLLFLLLSLLLLYPGLLHTAAAICLSGLERGFFLLGHLRAQRFVERKLLNEREHALGNPVNAESGGHDKGDVHAEQGHGIHHGLHGVTAGIGLRLAIHGDLAEHKLAQARQNGDENHADDRPGEREVLYQRPGGLGKVHTDELIVHVEPALRGGKAQLLHGLDQIDLTVGRHLIETVL